MLEHIVCLLEYRSEAGDKGRIEACTLSIVYVLAPLLRQTYYEQLKCFAIYRVNYYYDVRRIDVRTFGEGYHNIGIVTLQADLVTCSSTDQKQESQFFATFRNVVTKGVHVGPLLNVEGRAKVMCSGL